MNKEQFLIELGAALSGLPDEDIEKSLEYYSEMIDDRIEEGISEEEAVADLGSIEEIRAQIIKDTPLAKIVKGRVKPKRSLTGLEITLIIVGFPIWLPLALAAASVILSLYIALWSIIISLYAVEVSLMASSFGGVVASMALLIFGHTAAGLFLLGCSLACAGIGLLWVFVCEWSTKGLIWLTRVFIKSLFMKKGDR